MKLDINIFMLFLCFSFSLTVNAEENKLFSNDNGRLSLRYGFHIKVLTDVDIKDAKAAIKLWVRKVGEETGISTETYIYENLSALVKDFQSNKVDIANTTPLDYLRIMQKIDSEIALGSQKGGKKTRKYLLLVRSDSEFAEVQDLKGKKIAIKEGDDIGLLYLNVLLLRKKQQEASKFFLTVNEKKKVSQPILTVFFGQADACVAPDVVFNTMIELNPQVGKQLSVIASSQELVNNITFFRKDYNEKAKETIRRKAINIKETVSGEQVLLLFKVDGVVLLRESDLDSLKSLLKEYDELKGKNRP